MVVLPEPCRPTIMTPVGRPFSAVRSEVSTGPIRASSSSWQILTKWSWGVVRIIPLAVRTLVSTTSPMAFSRTRATNRFTTSNETSASRSDTRMSRSASSTTSGVISARPCSLFRAALNPLLTVSSTLSDPLPGGRPPGRSRARAYNTPMLRFPPMDEGPRFFTRGGGQRAGGGPGDRVRPRGPHPLGAGPADRVASAPRLATELLQERIAPPPGREAGRPPARRPGRRRSPAPSSA